MDAQDGNSPFVFASGIEVGVVLVARETLAVALRRHRPRTGVAELTLEVRAKPGHRRAAPPARAAATGLDAVSPHEAKVLVCADVPEARNVRARGTAAGEVLILEPRLCGAGAGLGGMV